MKTAVLLVSMGAPDSLEGVKPFLFRLFKDPAIVKLPFFIRWPLAALLSFLREKTSRISYQKIGGSSPLVENTKAQAKALEEALAPLGDYHCFVGMSYSSPFIEETLDAIEKERPDRLILLPLYPQYSTATSASIIKQVNLVLKKKKVPLALSVIKSFYQAEGFVLALADNVRKTQSEMNLHSAPLFVFSAHGLPESIAKKDDPYIKHCERTARALAGALVLKKEDWELCYQSRVGPMKWTGPSMQDVLRDAGQNKRPVVVVPIAFVSEHVETLYELDIDYREKAAKWGVPRWGRAPAVSCHPLFIKGLATLVHEN